MYKYILIVTCDPSIYTMDHPDLTVSLTLWEILNGTYTGTPLEIYSNKKETSDFHGTVSLDPAKMLQQK